MEKLRKTSEEGEQREAGGILQGMAEQAREAWHYGRDSREVTVARLRRWVEMAVKDLSVDTLDQLAYRCALYLDGHEYKRGDMSGKWLEKWDAEIAEDKREHDQARIH